MGFRLWGGTESDTTEATWQQQKHSGQHWLLIGWFNLRGFTHTGRAVKMGRGCLTFTQTGTIKQVCEGWAVAKSKTRVSEISSSS